MNLKDRLLNYAVEVERTAPTMTSHNTTFPVLGDSDGDCCLFSGLLSSVGVAKGYIAVRECQAKFGEKRSGMFYRSPRRRHTDNEGYEHFFSRDMALGVLLWYSSDPVVGGPWAGYPTQYHSSLVNESSKTWEEWINKNRACAIKKPKFLGGGCLIRGPYRYAPDSRSDITPTMWAIMGRVWDKRGWPRHEMMHKCRGMDGDTSIIEAQNAPLGYQLHLKAVQAYIKMMIGQSRAYVRRVGVICYTRASWNLFYELVARGYASERMVNDFFDIAPSSQQKWGNSWLWEKSDMSPERIKKSCGWDFAFMARLLAKHLG